MSPLIRFKNEERESVLQCDVLENTLPDRLQLSLTKNDVFAKIHKKLLPVFDSWIAASRYKIKDVITKAHTDLLLDVPNTCRYYTTACSRKLNRAGAITLFLDDRDNYRFLYCMINSSFAYWWWRIYDGGITYPAGLLYNLPLPINLLTDEDKIFFAATCDEMRAAENDYIEKNLMRAPYRKILSFPNNIV